MGILVMVITVRALRRPRRVAGAANSWAQPPTFDGRRAAAANNLSVRR